MPDVIKHLYKYSPSQGWLALCLVSIYAYACRYNAVWQAGGGHFTVGSRCGVQNAVSFRHGGDYILRN